MLFCPALPCPAALPLPARPLTYAAGVIRPAPPQDRVVLAHA